MKTWLAAAALGLMTIGGFAAAQTARMDAPSPRGGGMMARVDANGDGVITREEYLTGVDQRFDRLDVNHDGVLSADEQPVHRRRMDAGAPPPSADGSAPPSLPEQAARPPMTREQFRAGALRRFDRMDTNHDGRLDQAELMASRRSMPPPQDGVPSTLPKPPAE